ncbi:MAG TPA: hypothetical protein PK877_04380 [Synergistales bacterium]|nr:hypothetical protein [Synergistales bacterium]
MIRGHKKSGAVLPLTLVVLLLGIAFSGVVLLLVQNFFSTSTSLVREIDITGEAEGGLEAGKQWLIGYIWTHDRLPRFSPDDPEDLTGRVNVTGDPSVLRVHHIPPAPAAGNPRVMVEVEVFDLNYDVGTIALDPGEIFPPRLDATMIEYMGSWHMSSSYAASNRGEGSVGAGFGVDRYGVYLVRSRAVLGEKEKSLSEALIRVRGK